MDLEIESIPTEEDEERMAAQGIRDGVLGKLAHRLQDKERERFKVDYLVDHVRRSQGLSDVGEIVRVLSRMMQAARFQFPRHGPIDGAFLMAKAGEP